MHKRRDAASLLSGRQGLSSDEKGQILRNVLAKTAQVPVEPARENATSKVAWAMAACSVLVLAVSISWWFLPGQSQEEFLSRGNSESPFEFSMACVKKRTCTRGDRLLFKVKAPKGRTFFSAFAKGPDGTIVWYFPGSVAKKSIDVLTHLKSGWLDLGIELGDEHPPGDYLVFGLFSEAPLDKQQIRRVFEQGKEKRTHLFVFSNEFFSVEKP